MSRTRRPGWRRHVRRGSHYIPQRLLLCEGRAGSYGRSALRRASHARLCWWRDLQRRQWCRLTYRRRSNCAWGFGCYMRFWCGRNSTDWYRLRFRIRLSCNWRRLNRWWRRDCSCCCRFLCWQWLAHGRNGNCSGRRWSRPSLFGRNSESRNDNRRSSYGLRRAGHIGVAAMLQIFQLASESRNFVSEFCDLTAAATVGNGGKDQGWQAHRCPGEEEQQYVFHLLARQVGELALHCRTV